MPWPSWDQALVAAVLSLAVTLALRRTRPTRLTAALAPATQEFALLAGLYAVWRLARALPLTHNAGALERARQIAALQDWLHLPSELSLQHMVLRSDAVAASVSYYYAIVHVPATIAFLLWLFVRHRGHYPHIRNGLVFVTAGCLFIRFVRVAPPRFLTDLGYVDLSELHGPSVYGPIGSGVSDQFAAMPSLHVAWAAVVGLGVLIASRSRWRWVAFAHLPVTMLVVSASGHHWWLDGIVAIALLVVGLRLDTAVRRRRGTGVVEVPEPRHPASELVDQGPLTPR